MGGKNGDESKPDNIFDLSKLATADDGHETYGGASKKNTGQASSAKKGAILPAEQEQLLQNYTEVLKEDWEKIPPGIHIRYLRNDGTFRRGGVVKNIVSVLNGRDKDGTMIQLSYSAAYNSKSWNITLSHIDRIWQANAAATSTSAASSTGNVSQDMTGSTEKIEYLTKSIDQIKIDISKINNEQQRIVNLIKKLHNIRSSSNHE